MHTPSLFTISLITVLAGVFIGIGIGAIVSPPTLPGMNGTMMASGEFNPEVAGAATDAVSDMSTGTVISTFCPEGFMWYEGASVSFCYPEGLSLLTENSENAQFFFAPDEELVVEVTNVKKIPVHLCNRGRRVQVAGMDAMRITMREPLESGCGDILGFATTIESEPTPLFVRLVKTDGMPLSLDRYITVEQSIELPNN